MSDVIKTAWSLVEASAELALSRTEAKLQIKSHTTADDDLVDGWIAAAMAHFFEQTGRSPIINTYEYWLDRFPVQDRIELPFPPLQSIVSVAYVDANGDLRTQVANASPADEFWETKTPEGDHAPRGWIQLKHGESWPSTQAVPAAVRIKFTAGYGTTEADVPELVKACLRQFVGDMDRYRTNAFVPMTGAGPVAVPLGIEALMRGFKYSALQTLVPRSAL